jgi:hypothetical protein
MFYPNQSEISFHIIITESNFGVGTGETICFGENIASLQIPHSQFLRWARNQNNVSEWSDMSTCGLLVQSPSTKNSTQLVGLEQSGPLPHLIVN